MLVYKCNFLGISSQSLFDLNGDLTDGSFNGPDLEFIDDEEYIFKNTSSYKFNDSVEVQYNNYIAILTDQCVIYTHYSGMEFMLSLWVIVIMGLLTGHIMRLG